MSRCFPYPPPGYIPRSTVDGALIESIKPQRETKKSKEERHEKKAKKDRKREKKEKKREKKEKKEKKERSKHPAGDIANGELNDKKGQTGEAGLMNLKGAHSQRIRKDEAELLEKSDLTEEYGQPINSQNSSHSSDSTENSHKRKRDTSLSGDTSLSSGGSNHGNIIRLRLPLLKPKESPAASLTKERNGSEQLPLPKNHGPEASLGKGQSSSIRLPLLKHEEPEASVSKERIGSMRLPLKRKEPEPSVSKEQSSSMWLPPLKSKEPQTLPSKEQSSSMRLPLLKQKEPEASASKERSSSMRQPLLKRTEPEAATFEVQRTELSSSMRLPHLKRIEPEASLSKERSSSKQLPPLKHEEPEASSKKERSFSISRCEESETSLRKEQNRPLPKQREPEASLREESCSTSGRVDLHAQQKYEISGQSIEAQPMFFMRSDTVDQKLCPRPDEQAPCSTLKVPEIIIENDGNLEKASTSSKSSRKQRAESRYKALVDEWIPPPLTVELTEEEDDDEGWLFQKRGDRRESQRPETVKYDLNFGSWPRAQYLPVADVYALPFTVPL